jgi:hypothetical protein
LALRRRRVKLAAPRRQTGGWIAYRRPTRSNGKNGKIERELAGEARAECEHQAHVDDHAGADLEGERQVGIGVKGAWPGRDAVYTSPPLYYISVRHTR